MSYSSGGGGTLTLPSPTHVHHVDMSAAVRSLRRSISRSPSKFNLVRTASTSSGSSPTSLPQSPLPSPGRCPTPFHQASLPPAATATTSTSFTPQQQQQQPQQQPPSTPFQPSIKLSLRSARSKSTLTRPLSRTPSKPKSPLKRVFGIAPDSGNLPTSVSSPPAVQDQENKDPESDLSVALSPAQRRSAEKHSRHSMHLDISGASKYSLSKFLDLKSDTFPVSSVSPLKRSDATMNLDQSSLGSPVAKRRSLHGIASLGNDLNVFDRPPSPQQSFDIHDDGQSEYKLAGSFAPTLFRDAAPPTPTAMPRRTSSLRKTTLQQRHGDSRTSLGRRQGEKHLSQLSQEVASPMSRNRPRLSLDQYLPPEPRGSPFSPHTGLPNPSVHPVDGRSHQPHPLSRSLTQSSSGSSGLPDDSPTHFPVHLGEKSRAALNFSKSLPLGAHRPSRPPVATPNYKSAIPLQSAFMSTGLVSKMTRNPDHEPAGALGGAKAHFVPDTPCKKQPYASNTYPPQLGSGRRVSRPSFGVPSTPFSPMIPPSRGSSAFGPTEKGGSLFKTVRVGHARRASLLSLDGDDPPGSLDAELPPTPTKNVLFRSLDTSSRTTHNTPNPPHSTHESIPAVGSRTDTRDINSCKFTDLLRPRVMENMDDGTELHDATGCLWPRGSMAVSGLPSLVSASRPREDHHSRSTTPSPLKPTFMIPLVDAPKDGLAKSASPVPASPLDYSGKFGSSPQTSQEDVTPPDASQLSISNQQDALRMRTEGLPVPAPATPSTHGRESLLLIGERRVITPVNVHTASVADEGLIHRFDKAEAIGKGEFSEVFRVTKCVGRASIAAPFAGTPSRAASSVPREAEVYAVKKARLPYQGSRDRECKLREVEIMRSLRHCDHVVHFVDSWEHDSHLYIQMEYCGEGSLDAFLKKIGRAGRLDDFRIWKVLLELSQGLLSIHEHDFVHLDLKPANVFITNEGVLKIGDFGLAAKWPVEKGTDGEGDREYIGPEILLGQFDKPADIYSLGLIMIEIAANVFLPENGPTWMALREGDMSGVPSLTWAESGSVVRDATGAPIDHDLGVSPLQEEEEFEARMRLSNSSRRWGSAMAHDAGGLFSSAKRAELQQAPPFMADAEHPSSLDSIVRMMIRPDPASRPTASQILEIEGLRWTASRRRAGATVFEGNWGPADDPSEPMSVDTEMIDV